MMNPAAPVTGVDERAQLTAAPGDLVAFPVRARRPLDRELHVFRGVLFSQTEADAGARAVGTEAHGCKHVRRLNRAG